MTEKGTKVEKGKETRSETFKLIHVDMWGQATVPKQARLFIYSLRVDAVKLAEKPPEERTILLQPVEECELVFSREAFKEFAKLIKDLDKWLDNHQPEEIEAYLSQVPEEKFLESWLRGSYKKESED